MLHRIRTFFTAPRKHTNLEVLLIIMIAATSLAALHVYGIIPVENIDHWADAATTILIATFFIAAASFVYNIRATRLSKQLDIKSVDIIEAIMTNNLEIVLQPVYRVSTGTITGFESLVRMRHPIYGMIRPEQLMTVIDKADPTVARRLTAFVIDKAANYHTQLADDGYDFQMSINLHASDLADPSVITTLNNAILTHNVPHDRLTVELSNEIIAVNPATAMRVIAGIEAIDVKLALDDYGPSAESHLTFRDFLVDEVKIDTVVTRHIDLNPYNTEVVRAIVHTAHSTGTYVTAKCVETQAELTVVKDAGCDFVQGYIVAPPMTINQVRVWLKTQRARHKT